MSFLAKFSSRNLEHHNGISSRAVRNSGSSELTRTTNAALESHEKQTPRIYVRRASRKTDNLPLEMTDRRVTP